MEANHVEKADLYPWPRDDSLLAGKDNTLGMVICLSITRNTRRQSRHGMDHFPGDKVIWL